MFFRYLNVPEVNLYKFCSNFPFRHTVLETMSSMLLAVGVGVLGACLLAKGFFEDFWIFTFCFVMASCQYSLLKVKNMHYSYTVKEF